MGVRIRKQTAIACGVIGILQVVFAVITLVCCFVFSAKLSTAVTPYWTGVPLLLVGSLGIAIGFTRNQCLLTIFLIVNIILFLVLLVSAALTAIVYAIYSVALTDFNSGSCYDYGEWCRCGVLNHRATCSDLEAIKVLLQCFLAFAILGSFACLAGSICGCVGLCCEKPEEKTVILATGGTLVVNHTQANPQVNDGYAHPPPPEQGYPAGIIAYQGQPPIAEVKPAYPPNEAPPQYLH